MIIMEGKKFFWYLLALVFLVGGLVAGIILVKQPQDIREKAAGTDVIFSLSPANIQTVTDSTFMLDIMLDTGSKVVNGAEVIIRFDKNALEALALNPGSIFPTYPEVGRVIDNEKGEIRLSGMAFNFQTGGIEPFSGIGKFGDIKFRAKETGASSINFVFTLGDTTDSNVVEKDTSLDVLTIVIGSQISVSAPTATPTPTPAATPTASPTNSPTPTPTYSPGDVNKDGLVDIVDIGIIIDNYGSSPPTDARADLNKDDMINIIDIGIVIDNYGS